MSPSTSPTCTHDRGRGTTVCLRCRHERAQASQRRRQKFLMQFLGIGSVAAIVGVAGVGAASTLRGGGDATVTTSAGNVAASTPRRTNGPAPKTPAPKAVAVVQQSAPAPAATADTQPSTPAPAPARPAAPRGGFALVEGKTQLTDSIFAMRTGDSVVVNFDAYGFRTRRSTKLEQSLRLTLPMIFGKMATASLDTLDAGGIVMNRDVIGSLATEGMRLTLDNGATVRIRVLTRPVTGGPIAIGYLATIER
jgi:hypothetical protein